MEGITKKEKMPKVKSLFKGVKRRKQMEGITKEEKMPQDESLFHF